MDRSSTTSPSKIHDKPAAGASNRYSAASNVQTAVVPLGLLLRYPCPSQSPSSSLLNLSMLQSGSAASLHDSMDQRQQQHRAIDYSVGGGRHVSGPQQQHSSPQMLTRTSVASSGSGCFASASNGALAFHPPHPSTGSTFPPTLLPNLLAEVFYKLQHGIGDQMPTAAAAAAAAAAAVAAAAGDRRILLPPHPPLAGMLSHHHHHRHLSHQLNGLLGAVPPHHMNNANHQVHHQLHHPHQHDEPKPTQSYIGLIAMAILGSAERKLVLSDIYQWILDHYPYFRHRGPGWRNSIRHNLSLNDCFIKAGRSANGKGHYWAVHPANVEDFERGDFRRRRAQRKVRRAMGLAVLPDDNDDDLDSPAPSPADYFRSPTSASSGKQSAAAAVAAASIFADYDHDPRAVARTGDWMVECGVSINDVTVRNALLDVIKSSRNSEPPFSPSWNSPDGASSVTTGRASGPLSTRRRLFDMESILAPDDNNGHAAAWSSRTGAKSDLGQGQEQSHIAGEKDRGLWRNEKMNITAADDECKRRLVEDDNATMLSDVADATNASWYSVSEKGSISSCGEDFNITEDQLTTSAPVK